MQRWKLEGWVKSMASVICLLLSKLGIGFLGLLMVASCWGRPTQPRGSSCTNCLLR